MDSNFVQNEHVLTNGARDSHPSAPERYRLAVFFQRPHIYFCQFLRALASRPELDVTAYFYSSYGLGSSPDPELGCILYEGRSPLEGYRYHFLKNYSPRPELGRFWGLFHPGVIRELSHNYDAVIVHGWWGISSWLAYLTAFVRSVPVLVHSDRNSVLVKNSRGRQAALRWLFRRTTAFLVIGKRNAAFYRQHGVAEQRMFLTPLAVDNHFYRAEAARLAPKRIELRQQLGISENDCGILYVGRLSPEKSVSDLMAAFNVLKAPGAHLVLVGDGPERGRLMEIAAAQHLEHVHFVGPKSYEDLPAYYALADVFVLPSRVDCWGVVVNEAMNFALPVIASRQVGAADDLVKEGVNGFRFEAGDTAALAELLRFLVGDSGLRRRMGKASLQIIGEWDYDRATEGVLAALRSSRLMRGNTARRDSSGNRNAAPANY